MLYEEKTLQKKKVPYTSLIPVKSSASANYNIEHGKLTDKILWDAFKKGDELAFARIYKSYSSSLYYYGCKYSADKELVRDCLQDFFLYLRSNRLGFADTNCIKFYLFKAFRRRIFYYIKKSNNEFSLDEPSDYTQYAVESSIESIYINNQVKAEQLEKLSKGLNALERKEREAIYYFYFKGLSYEQIAEIFKFSHVSSARRVMYRGLRRLRHFFSYS